MQRFIQHITSCVREMIHVRVDPEFPYSHNGSGALFVLEDKLFYVSAAHNLDGYEARNVKVLYSKHRREFIPFQTSYNYAFGDERFDRCDIFVQAASTEIIDFKLFDDEMPYVLDWVEADSAMDPASQYLFAGHPTALREIDYDWGTAILSTLTVEAKLGQWIDEVIYELRFVGFELDLDGVSGAPVFQIHSPDSCAPTVSFAGMVQTGSGPSGVVRFLHARHIFSLLESILRDRS